MKREGPRQWRRAALSLLCPAIVCCGTDSTGVWQRRRVSWTLLWYALIFASSCGLAVADVADPVFWIAVVAACISSSALLPVSSTLREPSLLQEMLHIASFHVVVCAFALRCTGSYNLAVSWAAVGCCIAVWLCVPLCVGLGVSVPFVWGLLSSASGSVAVFAAFWAQGCVAVRGVVDGDHISRAHRFVAVITCCVAAGFQLHYKPRRLLAVEYACLLYLGTTRSVDVVEASLARLVVAAVGALASLMTMPRMPTVEQAAAAVALATAAGVEAALHYSSVPYSVCLGASAGVLCVVLVVSIGIRCLCANRDDAFVVTNRPDDVTLPHHQHHDSRQVTPDFDPHSVEPSHPFNEAGRNEPASVDVADPSSARGGGGGFSETTDEESKFAPLHAGDQLGSRFVVVSALGRGEYSQVWKCRQDGDGMVAAKVSKATDGVRRVALWEQTMMIHIRASVSDEALFVLYLDSFEMLSTRGCHMVLILPLCAMTLLDFSQSHGSSGLPVAVVKDVTRQVLAILSSLHDQAGMFHGDLKPENILCRDNPSDSGRRVPRMALSDFGTSRRASDLVRSERLTVFQTREYRAPEIVSGRCVEHQLTVAIDVFSLGCLAYELLTGSYLFDPVGVLGTADDEEALDRCHWDMFRMLPGFDVLGERRDVKPHDAESHHQHAAEGERFSAPSVRDVISELVFRSVMAESDFSDALDFFTQALNADPSQRATASALRHHAWLGPTVDL